MKVEEFLSKLTGVKSAGTNKWTAHCPCSSNHAHGDKTPSLSIALSNDGKILLKCHRGCTAEEICNAIGIHLKDLMPDVSVTDKRAASIHWMASCLHAEPVKEYSYCYGPYHDGLSKIRFQASDGKKTFRWIHDDPKSQSGVRWNHQNCEHRLYCAGNINDSKVVLVEGEKDADTVYQISGLTTVSAENGATSGDAGSKWLPEYTKQLTGKNVYILGDNDDPGRHFVEIEANELFGTAAHVYILDLTTVWNTCPEKGDISDMVAQLQTEKAVTYLHKLMNDSKEFIKEYSNDDNGQNNFSESTKNSVQLFDEFFEKIQTKAYMPIKTGMTAFDNLLGGGITRQSLVILNAAPSVGKTTLAQQISEQMAMAGTEVIFLNLEMSREQLFARSLSRMTYQKNPKMRMSSTSIMRGYSWSQKEKELVHLVASEYKEKIVPHISYNPFNCSNDLISIKNCLKECAETHIANGHEAPVVVLDYLHLVTEERTDIQEIVKDTIAFLKEYALEYNTFVMAISANNRMSNNNGKISMGSGRDSSALEYTADIQLALNYKSLHEGKMPDGSKASADDPDVMAKLQKESPRRMQVQVLKNRMGNSGDILYLNFDSAHSYFYPVDSTGTPLPNDTDGKFHSTEEYQKYYQEDINNYFS